MMKSYMCHPPRIRNNCFAALTSTHDQVPVNATTIWTCETTHDQMHQYQEALQFTIHCPSVFKITMRSGTIGFTFGPLRRTVHLTSWASELRDNIAKNVIARTISGRLRRWKYIPSDEYLRRV